MPLTANARDCRDHSGAQVFDLIQCPLVSFARSSSGPVPALAARAVITCEGGKRHRFLLRSGLRWTDGEPARLVDFIEPLARIHEQHAGSADSFWLRDMTELIPTNEGFEVRTGRPHHRFPLLMSLPRLAARRAGGERVALGRYRLSERASQLIRLEANPYWSGPPLNDGGDPARVEFVHVKDPSENVERFVDGKLDVTADTAFPYPLLPRFWAAPELRVTQPGIFVSLSFEGELARPSQLRRRARLRDAVDRRALCAALGDVLMPTSSYFPTREWRRSLRRATGVVRLPTETGSRPRGAERIRLAFDDYYPNREICLLLREQWQAAGVGVELLEDSFEAPSRSPDVRLVLNKAIYPGELGMYQGLLFNEVLRAEPEHLARYQRLLEASDEAPVLHRGEAEHVAAQLQRILQERAAIVPLAELPGLALSRLAKFPLPAREEVA